MSKKVGNNTFHKTKKSNAKSTRKLDTKKKLEMNNISNKMKRKQHKLKVEEMNANVTSNNTELSAVHDMMKNYDYTKKNKINTSNVVAQTSLPCAKQIERFCEIDLKVKKEIKDLKEKTDKELQHQLDFISGFKI